jgi:glycerol kinase
VERLSLAEGTALGAAYLAFCGLGVYDAQDLASPPLALDHFEPQCGAAWRDEKMHRLEKAVGGLMSVAQPPDLEIPG